MRDSIWGVECILAVIGTGGPRERDSWRIVSWTSCVFAVRKFRSVLPKTPKSQNPKRAAPLKIGACSVPVRGGRGLRLFLLHGSVAVRPAFVHGRSSLVAS
eukprot:608058-Prorocentrum_minimum.AAC.3